MEVVVAPETIRDAILEINAWHQNTPLILVFSRQRREPSEIVEGGNQAVGTTYNSLFSLNHVGIADDARKYYLHMCHGQEGATPYAIRKPTDNYGKTHQRIIKDTFGQQFLDRESSGKYKLREDFAKLVKGYLGVSDRIDLKPLVLYHFWNCIGDRATIGELWGAWCQEFGTDREPYAQIFFCSDLESPIPTVPASSFGPSRMKQLVLPDEYGTGTFNADFWRRFRSVLEQRIRALRWQGNANELTTNITSALMHDQSLFLLGDPGTGKTTIVLEAVVPALRQAYGIENEIGLSYHTLTPHTSTADLFGFQGLDGGWIEGPLVKELLVPYVANHGPADDQSDDENGVAGSLEVPRVMFLDEANRIDVEGILSPMQAAFDRLQKRMEPPNVVLGKTEYAVPKRIWRIFAGNSPVADTGRREQSRPFKRRCAMVIPPDPMASVLEREDSFRRLCLDLLKKASSCDDPEVSEPALQLYGQYGENPGRLEQLRALLNSVRTLRRVAVTVGLTESILLRAAAINVLQPEGSLDAAACLSLGSLVSGDRAAIEGLLAVSEQAGFAAFASLLRNYVIASQADISMECDPIL
jgi:MoxR-like ATPase